MENPDRVTYFAATHMRGMQVPFGIKAKDRARHMYIVGKTGTGKSTVMQNLAIQDARNNEGFVYLDPHGDGARRLLSFIPKERIEHVVYFAPADTAAPLGFNVLESVPEKLRHTTVTALVEVLKTVWSDCWSPLVEQLVTEALLALVEYPRGTFLSLREFFGDASYRAMVVSTLEPSATRGFWERYEASPTLQSEYAAGVRALSQKLELIAGNRFLKNTLGVAQSSFSLSTLFDEQKILIANLSRVELGETHMRLLGSLLLTAVYTAASTRALYAHNRSTPPPLVHCYLDDFQTIASNGFVPLFSEAHKYRLALIVSHHYLEQTSERLRAAIFGNVGTFLVFRVGPLDAKALKDLFAPEFAEHDLIHQPVGQLCLILSIDHVGSRPFSAVLIPPIHEPPVSYADEVRRHSDERYGVRASVSEPVTGHGEVEPPATLIDELARVRTDSVLADTDTRSRERAELRALIAEVLEERAGTTKTTPTEDALKTLFQEPL